MTCFRNLSKLFLNCYQTKTNRKMFQHDFQFFADLMIFFSQKKKSDQAFLFYICFSHLCKITNKKKSGHDMCIWMFSIRRSHFEKITWIFVYDGCHNQLLENIVSNLILWIMDWWQSHLELGAHLKWWQRKQNVKRWMWIFNNQNRMNHLT